MGDLEANTLMAQMGIESQMHAVVDFRQQDRFEELCRELQGLGDARRLDRPLYFWALAYDRRLPRALLGKTTRDIVETPFDKLCATPGIGRKKIAMLLKLLERAVLDTPQDQELSPPRDRGDGVLTGEVSEPTWERWREAVKSHGLEREPLGRFAASLQKLPRVCWRTSLANYTELTLEELRGKRNHGEKRVQAIVEVFRSVHSLLGEQPTEHLAVRIVPRFAAPLEAWLTEAVRRDDFPSYAEVRRRFVNPLLRQLRHDAGPLIAQLVASRLRIEREATTVRAAARQLGLTRARVYQMLAEPVEILRLRWPEARDQLAPLTRKAEMAPRASRGATFFLDTAELLFPVSADRAERRSISATA
jgi:hypothetical protein